MTCIIAIKNEDGSITLGGDKLGSNGYTKQLIQDPKVFKNGDFYFGYTTSFLMGQLLKYKFNAPAKFSGQNDDHYLHVTVREAIVELFKSSSFGKLQSDKQSEPDFGTFIMVYKGRIFTMQTNTSLLESTDGVAAVGCGELTALGAVYAIKETQPTLPSSEVIRLAMLVCSKTLCGVSKEYDIIEIPA